MQRNPHQQKSTPVSRTHNHALQNIASTNIESQRSQMQYNTQHEKWDELRHKIKSMRLNKIGVTSYLEKGRKLAELDPHQKDGPLIDSVSRSDLKLHPFQPVSAEKRTHSTKNKLMLDADFGHSLPQNKTFTSKNKDKQLNKGKQMGPYTPYFSHAYQLQRIRPSTNHTKLKQASEQNPEMSCNLDQKVKQFILPQQVELKLKKRKNKLENERKKIKTSASYYKTNSNPNTNNINTNNINININNNTNNNHNSRLSKSKHIFSNDLIEFSKLKPEDYTERAILRRKSNIVGDCMEAIEASVLKRKIILFTVNVTSGNANHFAEIKNMPPTDIFNDNCEKCKPTSEINNKVVTHTTTGSQQMRLMMGPAQILQYLQLFSLSHHPLQLPASTNKLGILLVDFLKITEKGLRIDKSSLLNHVSNLNVENKDLTMQQIYRELKNNQLVRWRDSKKSINRIHQHHNLVNLHQDHKDSKKDLREGEISYYRVYGHPHPIINSKQYDLIQSSQNEIVQGNSDPKIEYTDSRIIQPIPSNSHKSVPVSNSSILKSDPIEQNVSNRQTISILDEAVENQSHVISKAGDLVEEIIA